MSDIGPGTPLICVDASIPELTDGACPLRMGALYTVSRVRDGWCSRFNCRGWYVVLSGERFGNWDFCGARFRPLNGDDAELRRERDADPYSTGPSQDDADERVFKPIRPPVKVV